MELNAERLALLERRLAVAEGEITTARGEMARMKRRLRATWTLAFVGTIGTFVLGANPEARAQFGVTLTSLHNRLMVVENKTQDMSRLTDPETGQPTVRFSGVNVQIVDGSGDTGGPVNGAGNLIVGYSEREDWSDIGPVARTGSHNLIVGNGNSYSSYGGLVVGQFNEIRAAFASVSGGRFNTARGEASSVSGGFFNTADGDSSSVSGGFGNLADGGSSSVSGGVGNRASGEASSVSGGFFNTADGEASSVSGGFGNLADGDSSSVSGGVDNTASGSFASVSGGANRSAPGPSDWAAGGLFQDF